MLLDTHRPAEAEREARAGLAENPQDRELLHTLCSAMVKQRKLKEAREAAQSLIALAPDWVDAHLMSCVVELASGHYKLAERAAMEARRLAPNFVQPRQNLAVCYMRQEYWHSALVEAEAGLALDPNDADCARILSIAHAQLGHKAESMDAATAALNQAPENASNQYVAGAAKLQSGDHRQALEHFTEALRLDPNDDRARAAVVEAVKAHNPLYRALQAYGRMTNGERRTISIVGVIGYYQIKDKPEWWPVASALAALWISFMLLAILVKPFFNAVLLLDRRGRLVLLPQQRASAIGLIFCIVMALGWFFTGAIFNLVDPMWSVAILIYAAPLTQAFNVREGWRRMAGYLLAAGAGVLLVASLYYYAQIHLDDLYLTMLILSGVATVLIARAIDRQE